MDTGRRIDKVFLLHVWACVPFVPLWVLGVDQAHGSSFVAGLRAMILGVGVYLLFRTWIVFRGAALSRWALMWCLADSAIVTGILVGLRNAEDPTSFLYFLAIAYAALRLRVYEAVIVVILIVLEQFGAGAVTHTWDRYLADQNYMYIAFRHVFLLIVASLIVFLRREAQAMAQRIAMDRYQRDLSAEMHDGIQHDLVLIARRLDLAEAVAASDPRRAVDIAVEQRDVARRAVDELRFLIRQTRPESESETGFLNSFRQHLTILSERAMIPIQFTSLGLDVPFPAVYQHPVLRIVQEAVTNTIKHAEASKLAVRIRRGSRFYHLRVSDDGVGFTPSTSEGVGLGLRSIATRAEGLGGRCRIITRPGKGTAVIVRLPAKITERKAWYHGRDSRASDRG